MFFDGCFKHSLNQFLNGCAWSFFRFWETNVLGTKDSDSASYLIPKENGNWSHASLSDLPHDRNVLKRR